MRRYGEYCSIARAMDVVGDRWALLIVRELLLQGPCRFTDLRSALPGVAPNSLATRLKELVEAGVVAHEDEPPPVATALYSLTEDGLALEPALKALGLWGLRYMTDERPDDVFRARWLAYAPAWFTTDADPGGPSGVIQLVCEDEYAIVELGDGTVRTRVGRASEADLTLRGSPRAVLGLLTGLIDLDTAQRLDLNVQGRSELLARLQPTVPQGPSTGE
jgi:DNA-binding HxlR family transcriptional regulator